MLSCVAAIGLSAQTEAFTVEIPPLENERWWGGMVGLGAHMPFASNTGAYDLATQNNNNQNVPLLLSSAGRYLWSEHPFTFRMRNDTLVVRSGYEKPLVVVAGTTLKEACLASAAAHFPSTGTIPEALFFSQPQYNTWIELMYDQNQEDILNYAAKILENGFPTGILMIDDNWQRYYGNFDFKAEKFGNPKAMAAELHRMGFKLMLWVCPFFSPDTPEFREMRRRGYLVKDSSGKRPAMIEWWNGYSACLDVTNPEAVAYFKAILKQTMETYGVDGFKFDAGDVSLMTGDYTYYNPSANANIFSQKWAEIGLDFPFNELRTTWKTGGQPLVQRLGDKAYSWSAAKLLIPGMTAAGLMGFAYTCPDMIGGGEFSSFLKIKEGEFDEELIVRSCQIHALMPMMQFSVAPWRILSRENMEICARFAQLHVEMGDYILACAKQSSTTNEPIVRHMEYAYPHQGFTDCNDQFMLGDKYLVAPMLTKGYKRTVHLPKGKWKDDKGQIIKGPKTIEIEVPIERLPYYELLK
ncbi:MAG: glycoside hydrolase family 31 protein [Tannerellaceae bacterium]|nr:glycoside hydrolase family 31 protein [Tannerellaceae bacterium]